MATPVEQLGREAIQQKGWFSAHKWLVLRRISQLSILALFLIGPLFGIWIVKGNLASSLTLDVLPLTDPYVLLQTLFAGHLAETTAVIGALIVLVFYMLVGGRVYCSWVCPVNIITDAAEWLRSRMGIKGGTQLSRNARYWILVLSLALATATGTLAWELINPVSMVQRALIFGVGFAWVVIIAIFLLDAFISRRAWCGHLCPVGAFYGLLGKFSLIRVSAAARSKCDDCMECFVVCPESNVIKPALKGEAKNIGPVIMSSDCTNCGRCIDICAKDVFQFDLRFNNQINEIKTSHQREVLP
ncbi:MAG: quinol dehydrogenase ferredoxin subunit NapH [Gammaproteobacteria bacterium]|nr:quinol dehydrogenase ferredoxin subunit NapH [Gammaproteobacteria bacterium]